MKRLIVLFIIILSNSLPSQVDTTFTELRGLDDSSGVTHLFYRKHSYEDLSPYWIRHDDFYHLNLSNQSDSLLFEDYFYYTFSQLGGRTAKDFEFWNNNPKQFILCGEEIEIDPSAAIWRYDAGRVWTYLGEMSNVEISSQNDNLLYAVQAYSGLLNSTDGGYTWFADSNAAPYFNLVALSPINDQVFFSTKNNHLYKSTDSGVSYVLVDSSINWFDFSSYLFFDLDSSHVYGIMQGSNTKHFLSSSDSGNSWNLLSSSSSKMYLSLDRSQSGRVFLGVGNEIRVSEDYGNSFNPYWQFPRPMVGLYKKPDSDILYAATTKDIYEVTPADTVSIKHLSTIPVSIDDNIPPVVRKFELYQNYPNPFNPTTTIAFDLPKASHVRIEVLNVTGQRVAILLDERKPAGYYTVNFDGGDFAGGVYFYRLTTESFADVKKMVLMQ